MPRDLTLLDRLRRWGLKTVEVDGWQTRGSDSFSPRGYLWHHTAGAASGNAPSLNICIHGRSDLPGPLCQVFLARDLTVYLIAAGRANHAGRGGWRGLSGNSSVFGLETENRGTSAEPWTPQSLDAQCRIAAALIEGRIGVENCCRHGEWAPNRKVDTHMPPDGNWLRARTAELLRAGPGGQAPPNDGGGTVARPVLKLKSPRMTGEHVKHLQMRLNHHGASLAVDGDFGPATDDAVRDFQQRKDLLVDGVVGKNTWGALEKTNQPPPPPPMPPAGARRGKIFRIAGGGRVYEAVGGHREHIPNAEVFHAMGYDWPDVVDVPADDPRAQLPEWTP